MPYALPSGLFKAALKATATATELRHRLETWEVDSRHSAVTFCVHCQLSAHVFNGRLVGDAQRIDGSCTKVLCKGAYFTVPHWSTTP